MNTFDENNFHEGQDFLTDYFYEQYDSEPKGITSFAVINYLLKEMPNIRRLLRWNQEKMSDLLTEVFLKENELKSLSIPERVHEISVMNNTTFVSCEIMLEMDLSTGLFV